MATLTGTGWMDLQELRAQVSALGNNPTLVAAAQGFSSLFASRFDTLVLTRVFVVLPASALPASERSFAESASYVPLAESTWVLCLCGTAGREPAWNDRRASKNHLAIPLSSSDFIRNSPMIAKLLADLGVSLRVLDQRLPIASRELMAGRSLTFFVHDALTSVDEEGRLIIGAEEFARTHGVRSVFGMGGSYVNGTLVAAILFTSEELKRETAERFSTLIAAFKIGTSRLVQQGRLFEPRSA